jgi:hypothetical protein
LSTATVEPTASELELGSRPLKLFKDTSTNVNLGRDHNSSGKEPVKLFFLRTTLCNCNETVNKSAGNGPLSMLFPSIILRKFLNPFKSGKTPPEKEFSLRSRSTKLVRPPNFTGKEFRSLPERFKYCNLERVPIPEGIAPEKKLPDKSREERFLREPKDSGIVPVKEFPERSRTESAES